MLPNLVVIGAPKAGTTSLHLYLDQHPAIHMARPRNPLAPKEMKFFWRDDWETRLDWYESHFEVSEPIRGDVTPAYAAYAFKPDVPRRIHSVIPDARLIYLVRDPIARISSHYVQMRSDSDWTPFEAYMRTLDRPDNPLVCPSRYATQVEEYLRYFDRSQLLVIDQHDLKTNRRRTLSDVFRFLGVDDTFRSPLFEQEQNIREEKYVLTRLGLPLWGWAVHPAWRRLPAKMRKPLRDPLKRLLSGPVDPAPAIEGEVNERLRGHLQLEVDRLRELTGKEFSSWSL
jgi:hypothetical protein